MPPTRKFCPACVELHTGPVGNKGRWNKRAEKLVDMADQCQIWMSSKERNQSLELTDGSQGTTLSLESFQEEHSLEGQSENKGSPEVDSSS